MVRVTLSKDDLFVHQYACFMGISVADAGKLVKDVDIYRQQGVSQKSSSPMSINIPPMMTQSQVSRFKYDAKVARQLHENEKLRQLSESSGGLQLNTQAINITSQAYQQDIPSYALTIPISTGSSGTSTAVPLEDLRLWTQQTENEIGRVATEQGISDAMHYAGIYRIDFIMDAMKEAIQSNPGRDISEYQMHAAQQ